MAGVLGRLERSPRWCKPGRDVAGAGGCGRAGRECLCFSIILGAQVSQRFLFLRPPGPGVTAKVRER